VSEDEVHGDRILLAGPRAHHLRDVLRIREGEEFLALFPDGLARRALVTHADASGVAADLGPPGEPATGEPDATLHLFQAMLKGDQMSLVIQKAVELGVASITPVATARTVVQVKPAEREAKTRRWQAIARQAAEQSERGRVPLLHEPMPLSEAMAAGQGGQRLLCAERTVAGGRLSVGAALARGDRAAMLSIFVGPEGGFTDAEIGTALAQGLIPVSLGPRVLRAETAAIVACALVMYELGQMD
jgi:16S rRNA (uracil1498-N3)-methyltransferase